MPTKPTVVLVPGAWHIEHTYHKLVPDLERRGYPTLAIRNPSVGQPARDGLVQEDATHLRSVIDPLLAEGKEVLVVAHSYGGSVLSPSLADYAWKKGEKGRVLGLVYIAAFLLPVGKSLGAIMYPPDGSDSPLKMDENGFLQPPDPHVFYNDLPEEEQQELQKHLLPNPGNVGHEPGKGEPWKRVPAVYIKCSKDVILPPPVQQAMLDEVGANPDYEVRVVELDSSHSPMLSMPAKVGDAIVLAEELGRKKLKEEGLD
ncbi:Microsomal signal peptidase 12kDa subunit [Botryosphaeria dothidea]|uniref:Microsomal signal peptidase 12kDa subunit n=1 Tax=Botryosphaeria dothidea TaxID=55169 RepID=A0A8H4N4Y8_9PEZI|nr:Microsomal signal peptidase 12kDa subunit [Botryosphaeria dothidea]